MTQVISIEDILKNFTNIDLIKIDIEGSEYLMPEIIKNIDKIKVVCKHMAIRKSYILRMRKSNSNKK